MRVVVAPDCFTGSLTAPEAAVAISCGWLSARPHDRTLLLPMSDGGPGLLDVLAANCPGATATTVRSTGPHGEPVDAEVLRTVDAGGVETVFVESSLLLGRGATPDQGNPGGASSAGLARALLAAFAMRPSQVVVGLGGTLVVDAGAGLLHGLGARAWDRAGRRADHLLARGGLALARVGRVDLDPARRAVAGALLVAAADVDVPLLGPRGAALGFGPQKGADPATAARLEDALAQFVVALADSGEDPSAASAPGAGAAGGLGLALGLLGATGTSGAALVLQYVNGPAAIADADLVISGEGRLDWQSLAGKVVAAVSRTSAAAGVPTLVLAGSVALDEPSCSAAGILLARGLVAADASPPEVAVAMAAAEHGLQGLAAQAARAVPQLLRGPARGRA